jgi:Raf kinase inhibitor-like YbhB/YbcL family protein
LPDPSVGYEEVLMRVVKFCVPGLILASMLGGCEPQHLHQQVSAVLSLNSTTIVSGKLPDKSGCNGPGTGISPQLSWNDPPPGTRSFVLIMDDRDATIGHLHRHYFAHWLAFDLDPARRELVEDVTKQSLGSGERFGNNDVLQSGYSGTCPDAGTTHHYALTIYALDTRLDLPETTNAIKLLKAIEGHVLAQGQIMGTYTH